MPHKKGHTRTTTTKNISGTNPPSDISSSSDTTFIGSSFDQVIAKKKADFKTRAYGRNPGQTQFSKNSKTGKYTAHNTVKKLKKGGIIQHN